MSAANAYQSVSYDDIERSLISQFEQGISNYRLQQIKLETHGSLTGDIGSPFKMVAYGYMANVRSGKGKDSPKKKEYDDKFKEEYVKRLIYEKINANQDYYSMMVELEPVYVRDYLDVRDEARRRQQPQSSIPKSSSKSTTQPTLPTFYRRLGVPVNSNLETITKQYRSKALKYHPDKGGDEEKFKKLQEAYNTLKNTTLRRQYNQKHGIRRGGRRRLVRTMKRRT